MSIHDRDYARNDHDDRSLGNAIAGWSATTWLLVINIIVFVLWLAATENEGFGRFMNDHFTVSLEGVLEHFYLHTLLTAAFSHYEPMHILWNMLFLWWFGKVLEEDIYGARDYIALYVICGVIGNLLYIALPMLGLTLSHPALGASGAVMGIVVCCACFYPTRTVYFMMFIPIQLRALALIYIALDIIPILTGKEDGVGHGAHLGGALAGYLFYKFDWRIFRDRASSGAQRRGIWGWAKGLFHPRPKLRVVETTKTRVPMDDAMPERERKVDVETGRRVDELLAKISREGQGALTDEERAFLEEASRKYKSR